MQENRGGHSVLYSEIPAIMSSQEQDDRLTKVKALLYALLRNTLKNNLHRRSASFRKQLLIVHTINNKESV
jgi:hypothetical protein